jgi:D-amino-acid dehydrogenase
VLSRDEARGREPRLRTDIAGAVLHEDDAHLSPDRFVRWLRATLQREGVQVLWNREVTGWRIEAGRVVAATTSGGEDLQADEYAACGGSWSPSLLRGAGMRLPVEAGAGYTFTVEEPKVQLRQPAILVERRVAVTPMDERLRVGGTMELSGIDLGIRHGRAQAILESMASYYEPGVVSQFGEVKAWKGLRPCSPDGVPFVGRVPALENLTVATGHAMMGLSLGPITGKLVSQLLAGEATQVPLDQLAVNRFGP